MIQIFISQNKICILIKSYKYAKSQIFQVSKGRSYQIIKISQSLEINKAANILEIFIKSIWASKINRILKDDL